MRDSGVCEEDIHSRHAKVYNLNSSDRHDQAGGTPLQACWIAANEEGISLTTKSNQAQSPNVKEGKGNKPQHSLGYRTNHRVRSAVCMVLAFILCLAASTIAAFWIDLNGRLTVVPQVASKNQHKAPEDIYKGKTLNILLLGQDSRDGEGNAAIGGDNVGDLADNHQSDTALVVQISADRTYANVVSIPRDSIVNAPSCTTSKGNTIPARYKVMFNSIFAEGYSQGGDVESAAGCTLTAVQSLTGLDIDQFVVADFNGFKSIIDALGGVDVCIPVRTYDETTGLDLQRGLRHMDGTEATEYARMRHGTGSDGSDIMRTTRQQYLIKTLASEARKVDIFSDLPKAYRLVTTSLSALQISSGLGDFQTLLGLGDSLKDLHPSNIYARTLPVEPWSLDKNRVVWSDEADTVWETLREGKPLNGSTDSDLQSQQTADQDQPSQQSPQSAPEDSTQDTSQNVTATPAPDPHTGLITMPDKTLIDPDTGGIVDPKDGSIKDKVTGQYIGIADRYLFATVCAVPAQK